MNANKKEESLGEKSDILYTNIIIAPPNRREQPHSQ